MAEFKLVIADPKEGKSYQKEVKDSEADIFIGKNIKETIQGAEIGMDGAELQITGGSDNCGFPMRSGIIGIRKKVNLLGGVGFKGAEHGIRRRKTVCGHKINDNISQINLKVVKADKPIGDFFKEEAKEDAAPQAAAQE